MNDVGNRPIHLVHLRLIKRTFSDEEVIDLLEYLDRDIENEFGDEFESMKPTSVNDEPVNYKSKIPGVSLVVSACINYLIRHPNTRAFELEGIA